LTLVGTVFGAIHCAAWNAVFATPAEMWMWRTCSLVIAAIPGLITFLAIITGFIDEYWGKYSAPAALVAVSEIILVLGILIYIAARIILIVLSLADLRSLPASAFVDVNWSTYIPHI
ncbi:hypothetical protein C8R45DRAFT_849611, partial [Mycena sanguinolenta]